MTAHHRDVPCSSLEDQIVSGLALTEEKRSHLEGCEACRRSSESLEAIAQAARGLADAARPQLGEAQALAARVRERLDRPRPLPRWAWVSAGLAAVAAALFILFLPSQVDVERSGRELFALLDEVEALVTPRQAALQPGEDLAVAWAPWNGERELASETDLRTLLPEKYQWLWEILESRGI
jgi:anti-sigma factor RsiW